MTDEQTTIPEQQATEPAPPPDSCDACRESGEPLQQIVGGPTYEPFYLCNRCRALANQADTYWNALPVWPNIWERIVERRPDPDEAVRQPNPDPHPVRFTVIGPK